MSRLLKGWLIGLMLLSMLLGSASMALAAPPVSGTMATSRPPGLHGEAKGTNGSMIAAQTARGIRAFWDRRRGLAYGEVLAVEKDSLRIQTPNGEWTILTDETTRFRIPYAEEPGLDDVPVGARVIIAWIKQGDGALLARVVRLLPERPRGVVATITGLSGNTLTLSLRSGSQIDVRTDENTRFMVPGVVEASIADLHAGETVAVQGTPPRNEETAYAAIVAVLRDADGGWRVLRGELIAIDGPALRVKLRSAKEVQLLTDENTTFFVRGADGATMADLNVGDTIGAQIVERGNGTLYASAVGTGHARLRPRPGAALGRIASIHGDTIALETRRGKVSVHTDTNTVFRLRGSDRPGIDDLRTGQIIGVGGHWEQDGSLHARIVGARAQHPYPRQG
jgi:RNase P/RNase MRP subunit p29